MNTFPDLPGIEFLTRRIIFDTISTESESGRFYGATYWQYPLYEFDLTFEYLRPSDYEQLIGLFLESLGNLTAFWFDAGPGDNAVDQQAIGAGDGATVTFDLLRSTGAFTQPVDKSFGVRTAYVDGNPVAATFGNTTVTYDVAPGVGTALAWSGQYYYKCRFKETMQEVEEFVDQLHSNEMTLRSSR